MHAVRGFGGVSESTRWEQDWPNHPGLTSRVHQANHITALCLWFSTHKTKGDDHAHPADVLTRLSLDNARKCLSLMWQTINVGSLPWLWCKFSEMEQNDLGLSTRLLGASISLFIK